LGGRFRATFQSDGNFVVYDGSTMLWSSNTANRGADVLKFQESDGNIVILDGATVLWQSGSTDGTRPEEQKAKVLIMQDDGNLVAYPPAYGSRWSTGTYRATCPSTLAATKTAQKSANDIWSYVMGKTTALSSTDPRRADLDALRGAIINNWHGTIYDGPSGVYSICGVKASVHRIAIDLVQNDTFWSSWSKILGSTDSTTVAFLNVQGGQIPAPPGDPHFYTFVIDPEPAQTVAALSGASGASASAVYVNSQVATSVIKWPTSYTPAGSVVPVAGAACSPVDLGSGTEVTRAIMKNGNNYKCM
jgi:hypothetical protein